MYFNFQLLNTLYWKQNIPQDAASKTLQFTKNSLFYIWDNKKEISLRIEKNDFFRAVAQNFAFFENKKYTIKISGLIQTVGLFTLHLVMYFVFFVNKRYQVTKRWNEKKWIHLVLKKYRFRTVENWSLKILLIMKKSATKE